MRLLAHIIFTGLAALSVDTQKYLLAPIFLAKLNVLIVFKTFTLIIRIRVKGSDSLLTCFKAERLKT